MRKDADHGPPGGGHLLGDGVEGDIVALLLFAGVVPVRAAHQVPVQVEQHLDGGPVGRKAGGDQRDGRVGVPTRQAGHHVTRRTDPPLLGSVNVRSAGGPPPPDGGAPLRRARSAAARRFPSAESHAGPLSTRSVLAGAFRGLAGTRAR